MEKKWFCNGIPLKEYCDNNGLKFSTIMARIQGLKCRRDCRDLSNEEIVDRAINEYYSKYKYYYNGVPLKEYCEEEGLSAPTIISRVKSLKNRDEYVSFSDDELVVIAINEYSRRVKYSYKGGSLHKYCKENGIEFSKVISNFNYLKSTNKMDNLTDDEIIEFLINIGYSRTKYSYKGMSLKKYCEENGVSLNSVYYKLNEMKTKDKYKNMSKEEMIEIAVNSWISNNGKYFYRGVSLGKYCKDRNIKVNTIYARIRDLREKEEYKDYSDDQIVELAINYKNRKDKYWYKGLPLREYCKEKNIPYLQLLHKVTVFFSKEEYKDLSEDEIVDMALNYKGSFAKYMYGGMSLKQYCKENNISISYVYQKIRELRKNDVSEEDIIEKVIQKVTSPSVYMYKGVSLALYCRNNGLNYYSILSRVYDLLDAGIDMEDAIKFSVEKNEKNNEKYSAYLRLDNENFNDEEAEEICFILDIDYKCVELLSEKMDVKKAIKIIWYYGEKESLSSKLKVDAEIMKFIQGQCTSFNESSWGIDVCRLYDLYRLYKCDLCDTRDIFVKGVRENIKSLFENKETVNINYKVIDNISLEMLDNVMVNSYKNFSICFMRKLKNRVKKETDSVDSINQKK